MPQTDPTGRFVYVTNFASDNVSAYAVNASSGGLTPVQGSPFATGHNPAGLAIDPTGSFVYVATFHSSSVSGYSIDARGGALTQLKNSPFRAGHGAADVAIR